MAPATRQPPWAALPSKYGSLVIPCPAAPASKPVSGGRRDGCFHCWTQDGFRPPALETRSKVYLRNPSAPLRVVRFYCGVRGANRRGTHMSSALFSTASSRGSACTKGLRHSSPVHPLAQREAGPAAGSQGTGALKACSNASLADPPGQRGARPATGTASSGGHSDRVTCNAFHARCVHHHLPMATAETSPVIEHNGTVTKVPTPREELPGPAGPPRSAGS